MLLRHRDRREVDGCFVEKRAEEACDGCAKLARIGRGSRGGFKIGYVGRQDEGVDPWSGLVGGRIESAQTGDDEQISGSLRGASARGMSFREERRGNVSKLLCTAR